MKAFIPAPIRMGLTLSALSSLSPLSLLSLTLLITLSVNLVACQTHIQPHPPTHTQNQSEKAETTTSSHSDTETSDVTSLIDTLSNNFDEIEFCADDTYKVSIDGIWGMINTSQTDGISYRFISKPQYDYIGCFAEGLAEVTLNGYSGYIDRTGHLVIPIEYKEVGYFTNHIVQVKKQDKYGYINKLNQTVIPFEYDLFFGEFVDGMLAAKKSEKYGVINPLNEVLVPFEYDFIHLVGRGFIMTKSGKYGFWDKQLNEVIPIVYDDEVELINKAVELNYMFDSTKMTIDEFNKTTPKSLTKLK